MAEKKATAPAAAPDAVKLVGVTLLVVASVVLMVRRMPSRQYVEVHADKPRPRAASVDQAPVVPAAPKPQAAPIARKASGAAVSADTGTLPRSEAAAPLVKVELSDACASEIGLFCNHLPPKSLRRCLSGYDIDVFLKGCRMALTGRDAASETP